MTVSLLKAGVSKQHKLKKKPSFFLTILRPGFFRLNFPYFMDDDTVDFVIDAVDTVARHGWSLLPLVGPYHIY